MRLKDDPDEREWVALTIQEGLQPLINELAAIRLLLTMLVSAESAPAAEPAHECSHPEKARVDFGGMGEEDEWECVAARGGCGQRFTNALKGL